jgi:DNA helicase II / ATP-dependent DNA helicase PcrA
MDELLRDLNEPQQEAVCTTDGPLLIVAGAGSGKTRVITYKIAYIISQGYAAPDEITAVTFTNKASKEMKERVIHLLTKRLNAPYIVANSIGMYTFHSYCAKVLRAYIDRIGISRSFVIYDAEDQRSVISKLLDELNIDKKQISPKEVASYFSSLKNESSELRPTTTLSKVFTRYEEELRKAEALDFGDLIKLTVKLFTTCPDVLQECQDRAKYLFVDEYQDTNRIQYKLIRMLSAKHRNICVVGDEDQSIYKWRGADIRNILDFENDFKDARVVKLEENYRSTRNIISASSSLIAKNTERKAKKLFTGNNEGEKVYIASLWNDSREADYICDEISKRIREGFKYEEAAIFYRINAQSRQLEENLRRNSIPYRIIGGIKFYDRMEIRDLIAYLRVIVNPRDTVSLERIINVPSRGIGKASLEKILNWSKAKGISLYDALSYIKEVDGVNEGARTKISNFTKLISALQELNNNGAKGTVLLRKVMDLTSYLEYLQQKSESGTADERIDNVSEFLNAMADFEEKNENESQSALAFLESVSLMGDSDEVEGDQKGVSLMTLHSAKGLEFPLVFVIGLERGLLPYIRYGEDEENDIQEERRLLYVGMTRARRILYLTWARSRRIFGGVTSRHKSQFIGEIDPKFVEFFGEQQQMQYERPKAEDENQTAGYIEWDNNSSYVGMRVAHATYGEGVIKAIEGKGETAKVTVNFRRCGMKKLIWGYANLRLI